MRVELIYAPGCNTYKQTLDVLQTLIAEERLPIPVELSEEVTHKTSPLVKINGLHSQDFCPETLRNTLNSHWRKHTEVPR